MRTNISISVKLNEIFYFLMILPFFPIDYLTNFFPIISTFYSYARILVVFILLLWMLMNRKMSVPFILAICFCASALISSFFADISLGYSIRNSIYLLGICLIVENGVTYDIDSFIKGTLLFFEILIYANLIYYILNPNGYVLSGHSGTYYLFGNYNTVIRKVFPGIVLGALYAFHTKGRITIRFSLMTIAVLFFLISNGAATASIGLLVLVIGLIAYSIFKRNTIFKYEIFLAGSLIISFIFVIIGNFSFLQNVITNLLGKDMTLSSRTLIWSRVVDVIPQRIVWGYGEGGNTYLKTIIGAVSAHNIYLDRLLLGGVVGLILLGVMVILVWRKLRDNKEPNSPALVIFECAFCAVFVMWNFEPFGSLSEFYRIFIVFTMGYYCSEFVKYCSVVYETGLTSNC